MVVSLNKSQVWYFIAPFYPLPYQDKNITDHFIITTEGIISIYWPSWVQRMTKLERYSLITLENCIKDFLTTNWAEELNKENLRLSLQNSPDPLRVSFIKKDGSKRIMYCTLNLDLIPLDLHTGGSKSKEYDHLLTVYDVEEDGWRTINFNGTVEVLEDDHV